MNEILAVLNAASAFMYSVAILVIALKKKTK